MKYYRTLINTVIETRTVYYCIGDKGDIRIDFIYDEANICEQRMSVASIADLPDNAEEIDRDSFYKAVAKFNHLFYVATTKRFLLCE